MPDEDFTLDVGESEYIGSNVDDDKTRESSGSASGTAEGYAADVGDYVLATKYHDGDPCDHFCVGWVAGYTHHRRYKIVDENGVRQRGNGFRRAEPIRKEEGRKLVDRFPQISDRFGARSLWWHLDDIRGEHEAA